MAVPVDIFVTQGVLPIAGVTAQLFDPALGLMFVAEAVSDAQGRAAFLVPGAATPGKDYEVRLFKVGTIFPNPRLIQVMEPVVAPATNVWDVNGEATGLFGTPADQRLCRCVGRMFNYSRQPVRDAVVRVSTDVELLKKNPKVVDGALIAPERMETRTDSEGYFLFDLLRTGEYFITFSGEIDTIWNFKVPDRPTFNIVELLHPQPLVLSWGMTGVNLVMAVGATVEFPISVLFSDDIIRTKGLNTWIEFLNSDSEVLDVVFYSGSMLKITAKIVGAASITPSVRPELFPIRIPDYSLGPTLPLQVSVTP